MTESTIWIVTHEMWMPGSRDEYAHLGVSIVGVRTSKKAALQLVIDDHVKETMDIVKRGAEGDDHFSDLKWGKPDEMPYPNSDFRHIKFNQEATYDSVRHVPLGNETVCVEREHTYRIQEVVVQ